MEEPRLREQEAKRWAESVKIWSSISVVDLGYSLDLWLRFLDIALLETDLYDQR